MAGVLLQLVRIHDAEGALTPANLPSGGGGATANTDIFLQGSQSLARRQTNTSDTGGFVLVDGADSDLSADDVHVGIWFWVTHFAILDDLRLVLGTGTGTPTNYDSHAFPFATEYPALGGWVRGWIDVSRTPEVVGGSGLNESALRSYGVQISFTQAPGGNAQNLVLDAADHTIGRNAALVLTGTNGVWNDLSTTDENSLNQYGIFRKIAGVSTCFGRVQLGSSASSLSFSDTGFTIIFPQQVLVNDTFMGVNLNLLNSSTSIVWSAGVVRSAGTKRGDLIVSGTSGVFSGSSMTFGSLRTSQFTSKCKLDTCLFSNCGLIDVNSARLNNSTISGSFATSSLYWNSSQDTVDLLSDNSFFSAGTGHAIEFGPSTPSSITLTNINFSGYGSDGTSNAALYNNSGHAITASVAGGSVPTVRNGAGSSTLILTQQVVLTINSVISGSEIRILSSSQFPPIELAGTEESGVSFSYNYTFTPANFADIVVLHMDYKYLRISNLELGSSNITIPVQQQIDRTYFNP